MRRTLEGTKIKRQHVSGFRARMATPGGREVLNRRRAKGRHQLAISGSKRGKNVHQNQRKRTSINHNTSSHCTIPLMGAGLGIHATPACILILTYFIKNTTPNK